jgi:hypothetical protein
MPSFERQRITDVSNCSNAEIEYGNDTTINPYPADVENMVSF